VRRIAQPGGRQRIACSRATSPGWLRQFGTAQGQPPVQRLPLQGEVRVGRRPVPRRHHPAATARPIARSRAWVAGSSPRASSAAKRSRSSVAKALPAPGRSCALSALGSAQQHGVAGGLAVQQLQRSRQHLPVRSIMSAAAKRSVAIRCQRQAGLVGRSGPAASRPARSSLSASNDSEPCTGWRCQALCNAQRLAGRGALRRGCPCNRRWSPARRPCRIQGLHRHAATWAASHQCLCGYRPATRSSVASVSQPCAWDGSRLQCARLQRCTGGCKFVASPAARWLAARPAPQVPRACPTRAPSTRLGAAQVARVCGFPRLGDGRAAHRRAAPPVQRPGSVAAAEAGTSITRQCAQAPSCRLHSPARIAPANRASSFGYRRPAPSFGCRHHQASHQPAQKNGNEARQSHRKPAQMASARRSRWWPTSRHPPVSGSAVLSGVRLPHR
jgi:hypothetical protein